MRHTKEPWFVQEGYNTIYALSRGDSGVTTAIASVLELDVPGGSREATANARRIVACVNALAGIENPAALPELLACGSAIDSLLKGDHPSTQELMHELGRLSARLSKALDKLKGDA